jgi:hypothetical protein
MEGMEEDTFSGAHKRKSWFSELMKRRKRQLSILALLPGREISSSN